MQEGSPGDAGGAEPDGLADGATGEILAPAGEVAGASPAALIPSTPTVPITAETEGLPARPAPTDSGRSSAGCDGPCAAGSPSVREIEPGVVLPPARAGPPDG